jgi:outer membrane protein assembly factor BamB
VDAWGYLHWINKLHGTESARVKHSNEYGDGNRIQRVLVEGKRIYLLDDEGVISSYNVKPSNLALFKAEHADSQAEEPASETTQQTNNTDKADQESGWWGSLKGYWPF